MSSPQAFRVIYRRPLPMFNTTALCIEMIEAPSLEHLLAQFEQEPDYDQIELMSIEALSGEL